MRLSLREREEIPVILTSYIFGVARPTKFCEETTARLSQALRAGTPVKYAVGYAGISESTYYAWRKRGETYGSHLDGGGKPRASEEPFLEFLESVGEAQASAVVGAITRIREAMNGRRLRVTPDGREVSFLSDPDWRAAAWYLSHCHPADFRPASAHAAYLGDHADEDDPQALIDALLADLDDAHEKLMKRAPQMAPRVKSADTT